ncbi:LysR family transcriptional regulator [Photobacterium alginatilyticum]|uniref:LysR family transcriptional regulator n=1 Tax=Photobacterium alginatilyticum TaxID=1775171 RepID=UPI00406894CB
MHHRASQMVIFNMLATSGSFTKTAEKLNVSKSYVSKQLNLLEKNLDIKLAQRTTRCLNLTAEGRVFAQYCAEVVNSVQNTNSMMMDVREKVSGKIKLALPRSFGTMHIIPALDELHKKHPLLQFEISLFDHKVDMLEEEIDLWITTHKIIDEEYITQRIADTRFVVAASPEYLVSHEPPHHPNDLLLHNCLIHNDKDCNNSYWTFIKGGEQLNLNVSGNYSVDFAEAVRDAVIAGRGVGYISTYLLTDELQTGKLIQLLPDWRANRHIPVYAVYSSRKPLPARMSTIVSFLKNHIGHPSCLE